MDDKNRKTYYPGYAPYMNSFHLDRIPSYEKTLIDNIAKEWFVTRIDNTILSKKSTYTYILLRPIEKYVKLFNLDREIILLINNYDTFSPRCLDAFEHIYDNSEKIRLEKACCILLSKDEHSEFKLNKLIENDSELQVIVPITYKELANSNHANLVLNKFKKYFFERDFFDFKAELKKELYFFGRNGLVHKLIDYHNSGENIGLFGLRKTGKTSVAYAIQRVMSKTDKVAVFISCQDTAFHKRRWNEALYYVIYEILNYLNFKKFTLRDESEYTEKNASIYFEEDIKRINKKLQGKSILLIFDEIENISYEISPSKHWATGNDFIYFWQSVRSKFQKLSNMFTYLIIGTNPKFVEMQYINQKENPLFKQISIHYLTGFDMEHTKKMFSVLGGLCGIHFDDLAISKINEAYGGHPMLMRMFGSEIHKGIKKSERPFIVKKGHYHKFKSKFDRENYDYVRMIIEVLEEFYNDEYETLEYLALGEYETFLDLSKEYPELINHLLGYGIINDENNDVFSFKIESVKDYILKKKAYSKIHATDEERREEITKRIEKIEIFLRKHIRNQLKSLEGEVAAKELVLSIFGTPRKRNYTLCSYKDLFNSDICNIYFNDLIKLMRKQWESTFKNDFGPNKDQFFSFMDSLNDYRNKAAHSSSVSKDEMVIFRKYASHIEKCIDDLEN